MDDVAELAHWHQWIDTLKAILAEEIRDEARHKASTAKQQKTLLDSFKPSSPSKKEKKKKVVHASSSGAKFPGHGNVLSPTKPAPLSEVGRLLSSVSRRSNRPAEAALRVSRPSSAQEEVADHDHVGVRDLRAHRGPLSAPVRSTSLTRAQQNDGSLASCNACDAPRP